MRSAEQAERISYHLLLTSPPPTPLCDLLHTLVPHQLIALMTITVARPTSTPSFFQDPRSPSNIAKPAATPPTENIPPVYGSPPTGKIRTSQSPVRMSISNTSLPQTRPPTTLFSTTVHGKYQHPNKPSQEVLVVGEKMVLRTLAVRTICRGHHPH